MTYDQATKKATLDPTADALEAGTPFKATVKRGENGVKSAAGTAQRKVKTWTFTTARIEPGS